MSQSIALFDIDNTIYRGFSYFDLLRQQVAEGLVDQQVTKDSLLHLQNYKSGITDYETTMIGILDIYAAGLRGKAYADVLASTEQFYQNSSDFFDYVAPVIQTLQETHDIAIVTGEPQFVAEAVGKLFGIRSYYSSTYGVENGVFTGGVRSYLAYRREKLDAVRHLMNGHAQAGSFAFGDSEGDIEMLDAVQHPICLNATPGLQAIAAQKGWIMLQPSEVPAAVEQLRATA